MRNFFRCLDAHQVSYLLISGQASILYGAATFSEDVDIWVAPTNQDVEAFRRAAIEAASRYHKLTPPLNLAFASKGHDFHFVVPDEEFGETYFDVMFRPPRVGTFRRSRKDAQVLETAWGKLPVVGIKDLVLLKRTRRLSDYEVISNLVEIELRRAAASGTQRRRTLKWTLQNSFRAETLSSLVPTFPDALSIARSLARDALEPLLDASPDVEGCRARLAIEIARTQSADVAYWSPLIAELRTLRAANELMPVGERVVA